jgi:hypothetical protein
MSVLNPNRAFAQGIIGNVVTKVAAVPASGSSVDLFTVDGGSVLLLGFYGDVETALVADTDLDMAHDPDDGGTDVALATVLVADSDPTGTLYTLNPTAGGILLETLDVTYNARLASPITLTVGDIKLNSAGGGAGGGSIRWYAAWIPWDDGATLTAA